MKTYSITTITGSKGILYLTLSPRSERDILHFTAGQYASLSFVYPDGHLSPSRSFSIVSSPHTADLSFAIRIGGRFTKAISQLPIGTIVYIQGPFGSFTLNTTSQRRAVLFAGGIGITPMLSMIRFATEELNAPPITLLYSCRSIQDVPFYDELLALSKQNPNFSVHFFASDIPQSQQDRQHISGRITDAHITQCVDRFGDAAFYVCGPKGFNKAVTASLTHAGVANEAIAIESFATGKQIRLWGDWSAQKVAFTASAAAMAIITFLFSAGDIQQLWHKNISAAKSPQSAQQATSTDNTDTSPTPTTASGDTTTNSSTTSNSTPSQYQQPVSSVS